jgi:hypothetical protein
MRYRREHGPYASLTVPPARDRRSEAVCSVPRHRAGLPGYAPVTPSVSSFVWGVQEKVIELRWTEGSLWDLDCCQNGSKHRTRFLPEKLLCRAFPTGFFPFPSRIRLMVYLPAMHYI